MKLSSVRSTGRGFLLAAIGLSLGATLAGVASGDAPGDRLVASVHDQANALYSLDGSDLVKIQDLPASVDGAFSIVVPIEGVPSTLRLDKYSVRSDSFEVLLDRGQGVYEAFDPGAPLTVRGTVDELPGATVVGSLSPEGLYASVTLNDGAEYWVEPLFSHVPGAGLGDHIVYRRTDVNDPLERTCGTDAPVVADDGALDRPAERGGTIREAELGCDADWEYYNDFGQNAGSVTNRIELLVSLINVNQYEDQCGIHHTITTIIIRTTSADPYTSSDAGTLLNQFRNHWNSSQGGIQRDVAHLFTGRALNGSTIGIATLGVICTSSGYSLSENYTGNTNCLADLLAHELGHNWSAPHCDPCSTTMRSSITCASTFTQSSINFIVNHKNTRNCLGLYTPLPPDPFNMTNPPDGATNQSQSPIFTWEAAVGAAQYELRVDDNSDFSSPEISLGTTLTSYTPIGAVLTEGVLYYWKVTAINSAGSTLASGAPWTFTTFGPPPGFFVLVSPVDGASENTDAVGFSWSESSGATSYTLLVDDNPDLSSPEIQTSTGFSVAGGVVSYTASPGVLQDGVTYTWQVTAANLVSNLDAGNGPLTFSVALTTACDGDADGNNTVDVNDISYVIFRLGNSGAPGTVDGDADGNGTVDVNDISYVIFRLGPCP